MTTSPASLINNDTICAISTPPGVGGIAVIRLSGPKAIEITDRIWQGSPLANAQSHTAHYGTIKSPDGSTLDTALATIMRSPRSFTGEDTVEISVHGSTYIQQTLIDTLINAGARLAYPANLHAEHSHQENSTSPKPKPWPTSSHLNPEPNTP